MTNVTTIEHTVTLYSQGFCEFSEMVRLHLESRGQKYTERDVDVDPAARDEMMKLGAESTPVTVIDGEVVVGFDEASIDELLGSSRTTRANNSTARDSTTEYCVRARSLPARSDASAAALTRRAPRRQIRGGGVPGVCAALLRLHRR